MVSHEMHWQHCRMYTSEHENLDSHNNLLPGIADKSYTNQPEYIDLGMAFILYP